MNCNAGSSQWEVYSEANYTGMKYTIIPELYPIISDVSLYGWSECVKFRHSPLGDNNVGSIRKAINNISKYILYLTDMSIKFYCCFVCCHEAWPKITQNAKRRMQNAERKTQNKLDQHLTDMECNKSPISNKQVFPNKLPQKCCLANFFLQRHSHMYHGSLPPSPGLILELKIFIGTVLRQPDWEAKQGSVLI